MGLLLEDQSKYLLERAGITIPKFITAATPMEACEKSINLAYPVSLKVVSLWENGIENRLVWHANNPQELQAIAALSFSRVGANHNIERIIVQEKTDVNKSMCLSLSVDHLSREYLIQATCFEGAVSKRKENSGTVTERFSLLTGLDERMATRIWLEAGLCGPELSKICNLTANLFNLFISLDAYFIELNPLVFSRQGTLVAEHAKIYIDDNAMFRHPELVGLVEVGIERFGRPLTKLEKQVLELDRADHNRGTVHYVELDGGDIGFMCGSGGGSYMLFECLLKFGGRPANYSEFRGNPTIEKIAGLTKTILSKDKIRGLFIAQNITSNTQTDLVAHAVVTCLQNLGIDFSRFPVIVRQAGVNDKKAHEIFREAGIECYGDEITLVEAAKRMVERMREVYSGYDEEGYLKWQY